MSTRSRSAGPASVARDARSIARDRPRRRTQVERSAATREKLIGAATHLICTNGFAFATTSEIAAAAGVTRGAIQHHFEGRDDLVLAILHDLETRITASFAGVTPRSAGTLVDRIDHLIDQLAAVAQSESYLAAINIWTAARYDPELRDHVRQSLLRSSRSYKATWQRAFDDVPAPLVADCRRIVVAVIRGLAMSQVIDGTPGSLLSTLATCKDMVKRHMVPGSTQTARTRR